MRRSPPDDEIRVVHRDRHLLIVVKPTGLATTSPSGPSLAARVIALDPHAPRLHPSSRLDAEVTGLVTFARTRIATKALLRARREGTYRRLYLALAHGALEGEGAWTFPIGRDADPRKRRVDETGVPAATDYAALSSSNGVVLLALYPRTGRTHQLRVHASAAGVPLLGDVHYGGPRRLALADGRVVSAGRVMLHCAALDLPAIERDPVSVVEPPPDDFARTWSRSGGDAAVLERILAAPFAPGVARAAFRGERPA
jgi:23S rRNA-/tRNA-specific pseudouridylate synthase